jgi:hypothetical protein
LRRLLSRTYEARLLHIYDYQPLDGWLSLSDAYGIGLAELEKLELLIINY